MPAMFPGYVKFRTYRTQDALLSQIARLKRLGVDAKVTGTFHSRGSRTTLSLYVKKSQLWVAKGG